MLSTAVLTRKPLGPSLTDQAAPISQEDHKGGQRYLTIAVDHDSGRVVVVAGNDEATLQYFFDHRVGGSAVSADMAPGSASSWTPWAPAAMR